MRKIHVKRLKVKANLREKHDNKSKREKKINNFELEFQKKMKIIAPKKTTQI